MPPLNLTHAEFLELIVHDELVVHADRLIARPMMAAIFRDQRSLEGFDFSFNPSIRRKQVFDRAVARLNRPWGKLIGGCGSSLKRPLST